MTKRLAIGCALFLATITASTAEAVVVKRLDTYRQFFFAEGCGAIDTITQDLRFEPKAFDLTPLTPDVGTVLHDRRFRPVARLTDARSTEIRNRPAVIWEATGSDSSCQPENVTDLWATRDLRLTLSYKLDLAIDSFDAESAARRALSRVFGAAWKHGYAREVRCRRSGKDRFRCPRIQFIIGDLGYVGSARVRARARRGDLQFVVRTRVRRINEFCLAVGRPPSQCIRTHRDRTTIP